MAAPQLLVLAKHAEPAVDPAIAANQWPLTEAGRAAAQRLGVAWRDLGIDLVVSSTERKAVETGQIAAEALGVTFQTGHDLHEHERPFIADRAAFDAQMATFFLDRPAHQPVERRFTAGLDALVKAHRGLRLAVVAHGTVLSLHLAARYGVDAATTWSRWGMPGYVVVERTTTTVIDAVLTV